METYQFHYKQVHKIKAQDPVRFTDMTWRNLPKDSYTIRPKDRAIEIRIASNIPNRWSSAYLYMARRDDDIVLAGVANVHIGNQPARREELCRYADDIRFVQNCWLTPITTAGVHIDQVARFMMETHGYNQFFLRMAGMSDQTWYIDVAGIA